MTISGGSEKETSIRGTTGQSVFIRDQTSESLGVPFLNNRGTFELDGSTTRGTRSFDAVGGHGILVDEVIELADSETFMQAIVLGVVTNAIEIDTPINHVYNPGETFIRASEDMRVNGSVTPVIFTVLPLASQAGDITKYVLTIESTANQMDFTGFGSLSALTNGCVVRIKRENGDFRNLINFKTNGDFIEKASGHSFQAKTGGGGSGFTASSKYSGNTERGVAIRLDGSLGEELQIVIQDNLSTGLTKFHMTADGHELQE